MGFLVPCASSPWMCMEIMHLAAKEWRLIVRHKRVRNLVFRICREGMLSPILEKEGILRDKVLRRPGDVTLPIWAQDKGLAIDVAVTSPFSSGGMRATEPHNTYAVGHKHARYDKGFQN